MAFFRFSRCSALISLGACLASTASMAQVSISEPGKFPILPYAPVLNFFQLPMDSNFVEVAGVAVNSQKTHLRFSSREASTDGIRC